MVKELSLGWKEEEGGGGGGGGGGDWFGLVVCKIKGNLLKKAPSTKIPPVNKWSQTKNINLKKKKGGREKISILLF